LGLWSFFTKTTETHMIFYVAAVLFPAVHGLKYWRAVHAGEERFSALFIIDSTATIVTAIFVVIAAFLFSDSIIWPITTVLLIPSVQNLFFTYKAIKLTKKNALIEKGSLSYGIKTTLYSSLNIIANHLDKLLIYAFFSPSALALYFVSERLSELTKTVAQDLSAVLAPRFAKTQTYTQRLDKILNLMSIAIGTAILLFTFTLVPWIVTLLFGESYKEAIPYTQALLCSVAIGNHAILRNRFVNSKLDKKSNRDIAASTALIRILASVILVPIFGIVGAIVSAFIYRISTVFVLNYIIKHRYQSREKSI
jgi:O-antigen/teichoic acid export membrane protein